MEAQLTPTTVTIRTRFVRPSDLEVSWETDDRGQVYTWVTTRHDSKLVPQGVHTYEAPCFEDGVAMARGQVESYASKTPRGYVAMVQVNVTEKGGMNFIATAEEQAVGFSL